MVGDDGLLVVPYELPDATPFFAPLDNKAAAQEVVDFIDRFPQARLTLCADNQTQDYRTEELPPLSFWDKRKLAQRRLKQAFPSARLTAFRTFGKAPHKALLIGLHPSNQVFVWAERLRNRLPEIVLLPPEGATLIPKLIADAKEGWAMLIARERTGGFRQIVTHKGDLLFSRITPLPHPDASENEANIIARDIKASVGYLSRLGLQDSQELSVLLLLPEKDKDAFVDLSLKSLSFLPPAIAAVRLKLPFAPEDNDPNADILFAAHLVSCPFPALRLMLPETRAAWKTQLIKKTGTRAAFAGLAASLALTLWNAGDLVTTLYRTQKEAIQLAKTHAVLTDKKSEFGPVTEPLGLMRQALARRHVFEKSTPTPWNSLTQLSNGLAPDTALSHVEWKKEGASTPEVVRVTFSTAAENDDRADSVAAFAQAAQRISEAMPDFKVAFAKPPYPALPTDAVSVEQKTASEALGEIVLEKKP
jgi:hypothetical protein